MFPQQTPHLPRGRQPSSIGKGGVSMETTKPSDNIADLFSYGTPMEPTCPIQPFLPVEPIQHTFFHGEPIWSPQVGCNIHFCCWFLRYNVKVQGLPRLQPTSGL